MSKKQRQNQVKKILQNEFKNETKVLVFAIKAEDKFIIKSNKILSDGELQKLNFVVQNELIDPTVEFYNWIDTVGNIFPRSKIFKIPFFNSTEISIKDPWRICPIGEHWVRRHDRQKKNVEDVTGHCRKNPSGKNFIKGDELEQIEKNKLFHSPKLKASPVILNNIRNSNFFNDLISGWTAYWNDQIKPNIPLDPNIVKALIATESSFDPRSINEKNTIKIGPARGLMQITEATQRNLSGKTKDLKDHFVLLEDDEIWDPSKNISAGVRWLFRKRETAKARLKREPTWEEVLHEYKGILKKNTKKSKDIKAKLKLYLSKMEVQ